MKLVTAIVRPEKLDEIIDAVIGNNGRGRLSARCEASGGSSGS